MAKAGNAHIVLAIALLPQNLLEMKIGHSISKVKASRYNAIKQHEASRRVAVMRSKGTRQSVREQRRVSLLGEGSQWRITNWRQVATAMAKWA